MPIMATNDLFLGVQPLPRLKLITFSERLKTKIIKAKTDYLCFSSCNPWDESVPWIGIAISAADAACLVLYVLVDPCVLDTFCAFFLCDSLKPV